MTKDYPDSIRVGGVLFLDVGPIVRVTHRRREEGYEAPASTTITYRTDVNGSSSVSLLDKEAEKWWSAFLARLGIEDDPELLEVVL